MHYSKNNLKETLVIIGNAFVLAQNFKTDIHFLIKKIISTKNLIFI